MDFSFLEWLKTSIPGIIFLGAIGSICAVGFLKMAAHCAALLGLPAKKFNLSSDILFIIW
ncbi:hypothetical protein [Aeromonas jandaei]|uniref:hypothetical protein n=1 Tax=Aeromonas jandaei TaxID=650 RepID=UPI0010573658|nr:hypothetical protein [Aeromonas jandaei]